VIHRTNYTTLYRAGITNVVLQVLFMQQNRRVKKCTMIYCTNDWYNCGWPQLGSVLAY
jgi:hypothetical protein